MEISGIGATVPFSFTGNDKNQLSAKANLKDDIVSLQGVQILADEEVEGVFNETVGMIAGDNAAALNVHGGLSESRVFALLGL